MTIRLEVLLLAAVVACQPGDARPARATPDERARRVAPLPAPAWRVGDSTIRAARAIAADDSSVYVLADAGRALVALDARTGRERWRLPRPGAPLALTSASALARTPLGAIALLDGRERRIHVVGAEGRVRESLPLATSQEPTQLCALSAGSFVLQGGDVRGRLVVVRADGALDYVIDVPWPGADSLSSLQLQARLASAADGGTCAVALHAGPLFALVGGGTPPAARAFSFLEPVPIRLTRTFVRQDGPNTITTTLLEDGASAATSAAIADRTLAVAFAGRTRARQRVVDLYALADGRYRGTLLHDVPIAAIAAWGTRLYVLERRAGRVALAAFDVPALRDGVRADAPRLTLAPVSREARDPAARTAAR